MGKLYDEITPELTEWITAQRLFFVATAPRSDDGLVNCSPKGLDTLRVLGPQEIAYLDLTGSGIETVAHVRENGRIVLLFCAFEGPPKIVRMHGKAEVITPASPGFEDLCSQFPANPGTRSVIIIRPTRISTSCGFGVPLYEFAGNRDTLTRYSEAKRESLPQYRRDRNARSLDGLPGLDPETESGAS